MFVPQESSLGISGALVGERDSTENLRQRLRLLGYQTAGLGAHLAQLQLQSVALESLRAEAGGTLEAVPQRQQRDFVAVGAHGSHPDVISGICIGGEDGSLAITCSWDGSVRATALASQSEVSKQHMCSTPGDRQALLAVAATPSHPELVGSASSDGMARIWNMQSGEVEVLKGHNGEVCDIDFHWKQDHLACTASDDSTAMVWDCKQCVPIRRLVQHSKEVCAAKFLAVAPYERSLVTTSVDQLLRLWDLRVPVLQCAFHSSADWRLMVAANASKHMVVTGSDNGILSAWDLRTRTKLLTWDLGGMVPGGFQGGFASLAFSPCGSYLAAGSLSGAVMAVDLAQQSRRNVCHHSDAVFGLAWGDSWPTKPSFPSPYDGLPFLLCGSHDGTWTSWTPSSGSSAAQWLSSTD